MTADEHAKLIIGQLVTEIALAKAEIDRLTLDNTMLRNLIPQPVVDPSVIPPVIPPATS